MTTLKQLLLILIIALTMSACGDDEESKPVTVAVPVEQPVEEVPAPEPAPELVEEPVELPEPLPLPEPVEEPVEEPEPVPEPLPGPTNVVTLSWVAPFTREDGTSLALSEIAHFEIAHYWGLGIDTGNVEDGYSEERIVVDDPTTSTYTLTDLVPGIHYFEIRTVDTDGLESRWSDPVSRQIQ